MIVTWNCYSLSDPDFYVKTVPTFFGMSHTVLRYDDHTMTRERFILDSLIVSQIVFFSPALVLITSIKRYRSTTNPLHYRFGIQLDRNATVDWVVHFIVVLIVLFSFMIQPLKRHSIPLNIGAMNFLLLECRAIENRFR